LPRTLLYPAFRSFCPRYDPDEIEEEQRERERRNQINRQFNQFVKRVQQDIWERDYGWGWLAPYA
jgi:hypothetical protein